MANGWYMTSLTLYNLYPDCRWYINFRGVTVGNRALGFLSPRVQPVSGYGVSLG